MKRKGTIWIGTSGWSYAHRKGVFYPQRLKQAEQLAFYRQHFTGKTGNSSRNTETIE